MAKKKEDSSQIFWDSKMIPGRMISGSKSFYRQQYPKNDVIFNANIFVLGEGKIWHGDLDLTKDTPTLKQIAKQVGTILYVLREMDGRFENEKLKDSEIIKKAHAKIEP